MCGDGQEPQRKARLSIGEINLDYTQNPAEERLRYPRFSCLPVSKLLGHKSISTTERHYAAWVKGRQDRLDSLVTATWKKSLRRTLVTADLQAVHERGSLLNDGRGLVRGSECKLVTAVQQSPRSHLSA
jgi:hypothetical protein